MRLADIFLSDAAARAICWTLIHSLWQGILTAALAGIIIYGTRKLPAAIRYNLLAIDLLVFLLLAGITFGYELHRGTPGSGQAAASIVLASGKNGPATMPAIVLRGGRTDLMQQINDYLNSQALIITIVWLACLFIQLLRFSGGLYQLGRIRRNGSPASGSEWNQLVQVLAIRLGIQRKVGLVEAASVRTPSTVGWRRPSILVPLGFLTNLPPDQVETILLHELAHIRRNDYAANLVLHLGEAIFFFNPGFRWVATLLRREREACCDDIVLAGTPDRNSYLEALVGFTQWVVDQQSAAGRRYTLQLGGGKTDLLWRIRRMMNKENKKLQPIEKVILSFGLMALVSVSLLGMHPAPVHVAATPPDNKKAATGPDNKIAATGPDNTKTAATATILRQAFMPHPDTIPAPPAPIAPRTSATPPAPITPSTLATPRTGATPPVTPPVPVAAPTPPVSPVPAPQRAPVPPHPPTPEDPMIYATFQNPYAKSILLDLIRDGLAGDLNDVSFVLNADEMIVNHVRQPDNIYQTYRQKYIQSPGDHMIYSQQYTLKGQGAHCECVHDPDMPYIPAPAD